MIYIKRASNPTFGATELTISSTTIKKHKHDVTCLLRYKYREAITIGISRECVGSDPRQ